MNIRPIVLATLAGLMPLITQAAELDIPGDAVQISKQTQAMGSTAIPVGYFIAGAVPSITAEGQISIESWQLPHSDLTTLQIMLNLRDQLVENDFEILFDCHDGQCGGFDFRYEIDLLPEPEMHVDLGDYRYLTARKPGATSPEFVSLMVSRSANTGFVQLTRIGPRAEIEEIPPEKIVEPTTPAPNQTSGSLAQTLTTIGSAPLDDLVFETGSSHLGDRTFGSLVELSGFLKTNPNLKIALVGHTDTEGSLSNNLALSRKRAASVKERLILAHGVSVSQIEAAGVGYLSPRASNLTEEGRTQNRRVEVILTSVSTK